MDGAVDGIVVTEGTTTQLSPLRYTEMPLVCYDDVRKISLFLVTKLIIFDKVKDYLAYCQSVYFNIDFEMKNSMFLCLESTCIYKIFV